MKQSGLQRARQSTRKKIKKSLGPDFLDPSNLGLHGKEAQSDVRCDICQEGLPSGSRRDSMSCRKCPVQAHASCIRAQLNVKYIKSLWLCLNCRHCYECDETGVDQSELIFCRTCDLSYHYDCIRSISSSGGKWVCLQCKKPQLPISRFHGFRHNRVAKTLNKSHTEDKSPDITTSHPSSSSSTPSTSTSRASLSVKKELINEKQKPRNHEKYPNNERPLRSDQAERQTRSERPERSVNANSNNSRRQERSEKPERTERQEKTERTDRPERPIIDTSGKRLIPVFRSGTPKPGNDDNSFASVKRPERPASIDPMSSKRPERPTNIDSKRHHERSINIDSKRPERLSNIDSAGSRRPERSMSMDSMGVKRSMPIASVNSKKPETDDINFPFVKRPERPASIDQMSSKRPERSMNIDPKRHHERSSNIDSISSKRPERPINIDSANSKKPERPLSMGSMGVKQPDRPNNIDSIGSKRPDRPMSIESIGSKRPERPISIDSSGPKRIERPLSIDSINSKRPMNIDSVSTKRPMSIELVSSKRPMRVNQVVNDNRSSIDLPDVDMKDSFTEKPLVKEIKDKYLDKPRLIRNKVEPERENNMIRSKEMKDKDEKQQSTNENRRMSEERSENNRNPMNVKANGPTRGNTLLSLNDLGNGKSDGVQSPIPPKVTVPKKDASEIQGSGFILSKPVELTEETTQLLKDSNGAKRLKLVLFERACKAESLLPAETPVWTVEDVHNFIKFIGFPDAAENFSEHQIDGKSLLLLSRKDVITGFKLKLGPALKIYAHIFRLQRKRPALLLEEQ